MLIKHVVSILLILICTSCSFYLDTEKPVELVWDQSGEKVDSLVIFLPGLLDTAKTFKEEHFFSSARKAGVKADMVAAGIHLRHLIKKVMIERVEKDIFQHIQDRGYKNIWFVGMSLGGLNSLLFYQKHAKNICGVILLAPYLADESLAKELNGAGNIESWKSKQTETTKVVKQNLRFIWEWLQQQALKNNLDQIYLGYGKSDKYQESISILHNMLDEENVVVIEGKHDWKTAHKIWQQQLSSRDKTGLLQTCN